MSSRSQPLVSVVTPVYNGSKYLEECIKSVVSQTYKNWEYVIADNCSTDRSLAIARQYAAKDRRIRAVVNNENLPIMRNWNNALRQISPNSKYCKVVHADDWLFPECIEKMVAIAEEYPNVGIVSAYRLDETCVGLDGIVYDRRVFSGKEICRRTLKGGFYVSGSPTSLLVRSDLIRERNEFYNPDNLHADLEACYDVLRESDFGFVHQVLTFTRRHNESETSFSSRMNSHLVGDVTALVKYGPSYLTPEEYGKRFQQLMTRYYCYLAKNVLHRRGTAFWQYHKAELKKLGLPFRRTQLARAWAAIMADHVMHPVSTLRGVIANVREHGRLLGGTP
jgi:glycosyltransferase involved in cell wall biosynthesis